VVALRGQLGPIEAELIKVQRMRAVLAEEIKPPGDPLAKVLASQTIAGRAPSIAAVAASENPYATRTIKDLVVQALLDAFPYGATTIEMRDFIRTGYGRTIDPSSLRTQLHRMKAAGIVGQDASNDNWNFRDGKRQLYSMYDHPTSRRGMQELQDESA